MAIIQLCMYITWRTRYLGADELVLSEKKYDGNRCCIKFSWAWSHIYMFVYPRLCGCLLMTFHFNFQVSHVYTCPCTCAGTSTSVLSAA